MTAIANPGPCSLTHLIAPTSASTRGPGDTDAPARTSPESGETAPA